MSRTPFEWHRRELGKAAELATVDPIDFLSVSPEAGATWFLAQFDGLRSLVALTASSAHPVLLVDGDEDGGASP